MIIALPQLSAYPLLPTSIKYPLEDAKSAAAMCMTLWEDTKTTKAAPSYTTSTSVLMGYDISLEDKKNAQQADSVLLYGELLPQGVHRALERGQLDAASATSLYDLGMGMGKLCLQAFLSYPSLKKVVGVELASSRFALGVKAIKRLVNSNPTLFCFEEHCDRIRLCFSTDLSRLLEYRLQNLYDCLDAVGPEGGDILICELDIPSSSFNRFTKMLDQAKTGSRLMMLKALRPIYEAVHGDDCNMPWDPISSDTFCTTWNTKGDSARLGIFRKL